MVVEKGPKAVHFTDDLPGEPAGVGLVLLPNGNGKQEERIEIRPRFRVGRFFGKRYQLPQPGGDDFSEAAKIGFLSFRQGIGFADQMGQAGLTVNPFSV